MRQRVFNYIPNFKHLLPNVLGGKALTHSLARLLPACTSYAKECSHLSRDHQAISQNTATHDHSCMAQWQSSTADFQQFRALSRWHRDADVLLYNNIHTCIRPIPRQNGGFGCLVTSHSSISEYNKVKVAHTRLPSVGFRSWSRFLAVSLQVTWVMNPAIGCHYFPPGLQLPPQPLRELLPISLVGEERHGGCEQFA